MPKTFYSQKRNLPNERKTAGNMVFSAMLADEYILIVLFAYHLQSGLDE